MLLDLIPRKKPDVGALMKKRDIPGLIRAFHSGILISSRMPSMLWGISGRWLSGRWSSR